MLQKSNLHVLWDLRLRFSRHARHKISCITSSLLLSFVSLLFSVQCSVRKLHRQIPMNNKTFDCFTILYWFFFLPLRLLACKVKMRRKRVKMQHTKADSRPNDVSSSARFVPNVENWITFHLIWSVCSRAAKWMLRSLISDSSLLFSISRICNASSSLFSAGTHSAEHTQQYNICTIVHRKKLCSYRLRPLSSLIVCLFFTRIHTKPSLYIFIMGQQQPSQRRAESSSSTNVVILNWWKHYRECAKERKIMKNKREKNQ